MVKKANVFPSPECVTWVDTDLQRKIKLPKTNIYTIRYQYKTPSPCLMPRAEGRKAVPPCKTFSIRREMGIPQRRRTEITH